MEKSRMTPTYILHPVHYAEIIKAPAVFIDQITMDVVSEVGFTVTLSSGAKMFVMPAMSQNWVVHVLDSGRMEHIDPKKFLSYLTRKEVKEGIKWSKKVQQERLRRNRISAKKRIAAIDKILKNSMKEPTSAP